MIEKSYRCRECDWVFNLDMHGSHIGLDFPNYCPNCSHKWEVKITPAEIVEKIRSIYHFNPIHSIEDEKRMLTLLIELKEMAESNKKYLIDGNKIETI